jgi:nucleoside-diphosphate-sugar epimerase
MSNARARDFGWAPHHAPDQAVAEYAAWLLASANQGLP